MYGAAYDSFAEAIRIYPENRILFYYSGVCAARMSQAAVDDESRSLWLERADKLYRRAADLDPRYADALYARAVLLAYELDRPAEAAALARRVLEIEAKNVEAMFLLGGLDYRLGRLEDALAVYQEVEKLTTVPERRAEALANQQQIREELYGTQ
jgi:tetratricopeptide (TPR) repeat protein